MISFLRQQTLSSLIDTYSHIPLSVKVCIWLDEHKYSTSWASVVDTGDMEGACISKRDKWTSRNEEVYTILAPAFCPVPLYHPAQGLYGSGCLLASSPCNWSVCAQLCPALCDSMDYGPPCSSVHGILQARVLGWAAISSCRDLPDPGIEPMSPVSPVLAGGSFTTELPGKPCIWSTWAQRICGVIDASGQINNSYWQFKL